MLPQSRATPGPLTGAASFPTRSKGSAISAASTQQGQVAGVPQRVTSHNDQASRGDET